MKIILEEHPYEVAFVRGNHVFDGLTQLEDIHQRVSVKYVGYYYNATERDCVFVLPKVLMDEQDRVFGHKPEDIVDLDHSKLSDFEKKFLFEFAVWIYRSISVFNRQNPQNEIVKQRELPKIGHGCKRTSSSYLDVLLSLLQFNRENQDFVMFTIKNLHSGYNKIHWNKTISKSQALLQNGSPIYLNPINRRKEVNFDEELLVIFFSILHHICQKFGFRTQFNCNFNLLNESQMEYYKQGLGKKRLLQIKYKYFSDRALRLWELCYALFDRAKEIEVSANLQEYLLVENYYEVFEAIVDELIGDKEVERRLYQDGDENVDDLLLQKKQRDGKRVDHIYRYASLTQPDSQEEVYYIGDSKYYKTGHDLGNESIYKQYTYARNVIQWNTDLVLDGKNPQIRLRDDLTEGYNVVPNFFISAFLDKDLNYDNDGLQLIKVKDRYGNEQSCYISRQFQNRLFDRDTLLLSRYNVNFLFVVKLYARDCSSDKHQWMEKVRGIFRKEVQDVLKDKFQFFAMTPKDGNSLVAQNFLDQHFKESLGRVFRPYVETGESCRSDWYMMALDRNDGATADKMRKLMEDAFVVDEMQLGEMPDNWNNYRPQKLPHELLLYGDELTFVGYVKSDNPWISDFENHTAKIYYTGTNNVPDNLNLQEIRFLMPIVKGKVGGVYHVKAVKVAPKGNFGLAKDPNSVRYFFELGEYISFGEHRSVNPRSSDRTYFHDGLAITLMEARFWFNMIAE